MPTNKSGLIKIVKVPAGEAPENIRRAWIGLTLPCGSICGYPNQEAERGVVTREKTQQNRRGFQVSQLLAIAILAKHAPSAAQWWRSQGYPKPAEFFHFGADEAEIISGVTQQKNVEVTEEMRGNPNR